MTALLGRVRDYRAARTMFVAVRPAWRSVRRMFRGRPGRGTGVLDTFFDGLEPAGCARITPMTADLAAAPTLREPSAAHREPILPALPGARPFLGELK